ncbi:MAG: ferritin-like domain-containing protein [Sphingomonas phyllosphaerae]|uniref:ferritin-like domain-containing protein n=1 Tax=Sphingomonas phyllosphaerae TaxID=257003 RepID=UPI002FF86292
MLSYIGPAAAQTTSDISALNFALNLSYLQGQFFSYVVTGGAVAAQIGTGAIGAVTPGRKVKLDDATTALITEIGNDTRNVATPMRVIIGALAIGQPALDITGGTTGPFATVMQQAGVVATGASFDPYASEENMLYSAFYLKDTALAAYRGLLPLLTNRVVVQLFCGLIATEAHHAAVIRGLLYARGATAAQMRTNADKIAAFRRMLGGEKAGYGISGSTRTYTGPSGAATTVKHSNVTSADNNGEVGQCTPEQVLAQLYLSRTAATQGGFFPVGVNGTFRTSASI